MVRRLILLLVVLPSLLTEAQDINGIWKGRLVMAPGGCFPVYNIEMQLQVAGSRISGTVYHYSDSLNFVKENFEGVYKKDSNSINIQETGIITFKLNDGCVPCIKTYALTYHKGSGPEEQIRGDWKTIGGK